MKRFTNWCLISHGHELTEDLHGTWVLFSDHELEIDRVIVGYGAVETNLERLQNKFEQVTGENVRLSAERSAAFMAGYEWAALSKGTPEQGLAEFVSGRPEQCHHKFGDDDGYHMDHCVYCGASHPGGSSSESKGDSDNG